MVYLQLQFRICWSDAPPSCGVPIQGATSVDSAVLIMAAHSARRFKENVPVGDNSWHDCMAWCSIPDPAPPAYATHGFAATIPRKHNPVSNPGHGIRPLSQGVQMTTTDRTTQTHPSSATQISTEAITPSERSQDHPHCNIRHAADGNCMDDDNNRSENGHPCRFGRPCGVLLTDLSEDGLNRHLAQYHLQDMQDNVVRMP